MGLDRSVPPAGHFNCLASTRTPCDTRDNTSQAAFEAEACGGDRDEGSYTLNNPKGVMRFFGKYWLTDYRFAMVTRTTELILPVTPRRIFSFFHCFP
jgi:hypothetical protein